MKKTLFVTCGLLTTQMIFGQQKMDLKPQVSVPPSTYDQLALSTGFTNPNTATADLFGKNGKSEVSIPNNYMGSQESAEGDYYFGIMTYKGDREIDWTKIGDGGITEGKPDGYAYSEYLQVALPQSLVAGKEYEAIIKVSLADNSAYATKGFGIYFSDAQMNNKSSKLLSVEPQVSFNELVTDKNGWTQLKTKFKATGNEKFATIGCFKPNYTVEKVGNGKGFGTVRAYYYIASIGFNEAPKPDRDKDGIPDESDKCPDVAGVEKFNGCPDTDGDGITDKDDACPTVAGLTQFQGCPDTDNDGIADNKDKCPKVAGTKENSGCPEIKINDKAKEVFQKAMSGIQFESGKDIIKKTSYPILDNVVTVLKENPDWNVEIQGHTDNVGNPESNKTLSHKRAMAVERYLVEKGVTNSLRPNGYGSEKPIADNKTPAGRAKNRRVEFNVTYEK